MRDYGKRDLSVFIEKRLRAEAQKSFQFLLLSRRARFDNLVQENIRAYVLPRGVFFSDGRLQINSDLSEYQRTKVVRITRIWNAGFFF